MWPFSKKKTLGRDFSQEERDRGNDTKKFEADLRRQRIQAEHDILMLEKKKQMLELKADIADLQEELGGDEDGEDASDLFTGLLAKAAPAFIPTLFANPQQAPANSETPTLTTPQPVTAGASVEFSDDQIKAIWDSQPANVKAVAKIAPDEQITEYLQKKIPGISAETCARALNIVKGRKSSI